MNLAKKFIKEEKVSWWNQERKNRPEEGTSQDMCPTNGEAVIFTLIMSIAWLPLFIVLFVKFILNGG